MKKGKWMLNAVAMLLVMVMAVGLFAGCSQKEDASSSSNESVTQAEEKSGESTETHGAVEEEAKEIKMAWYASAPHPYFEEVIKGVQAFEVEFDQEVLKQIGPDWNQASQNENMELGSSGI